MKERKHEAPPRYDAAFKEGASRLVSSKTGLCAEYVPEGRAPRQCGGGKFLQLPQVRIGISDQLCDPSAGAKFNFSRH